MFLLIILAACLIAVAVGYFFNIYVVLVLVTLLCVLFGREARRPNTLPGTSGKMGATIEGFMVLAPFVIVTLFTSFIVNRGLLLSLVLILAHFFSTIFLR
jgi:heme/copper-type cytochrome/quinol oxidase subunit 2